VINNYFGQHIEGQFKELFELQESIYDTGARNFLFFNVPNFERAPCCRFPKIPTIPHSNLTTIRPICTPSPRVSILFQTHSFSLCPRTDNRPKLRRLPSPRPRMEFPPHKSHNHLPHTPPGYQRRNLQCRGLIR